MENTHGRWFGSLELRFEAASDRTVMARSAHVGPLRVQRPFREADGACQVYILNPPGGTVGGDELRVFARALRGARALLTAPGAAKFYRSAGPIAKTTQHLEVESGGRLEWLPQETIVFDGAVAAATTKVELNEGAAFIGWEVTCLGRPAARERFDRGAWTQRFELWTGGTPLWLERSHFAGSDPALTENWGLASRPVYGSMVAHPVPPAALELARGAATSDPETWFGATLLEHADKSHTLVARVIGLSSARARQKFTQVWERIRPEYFGSKAEAPRIWAT